jgi:hypothetical protein
VHYKNGREVNIGDKVVVMEYGRPIGGIVVEAHPRAETCNLMIVPTPLNTHCVTASECLHADDVFLGEDGRPTA